MSAATVVSNWGQQQRPLPRWRAARIGRIARLGASGPICATSIAGSQRLACRTQRARHSSEHDCEGRHHQWPTRQEHPQSDQHQNEHEWQQRRESCCELSLNA